MSDEGEKKPSLRETARRYGEAKRAGNETPSSPPSPPPSSAPREKPFIPFVRFEDVVVKCGHVEKFGILPDNKDRFREDRRKKAISRDCKECREKKQVDQLAAAEVRRVEKEQQVKTSPPPRPKTERLPGGSRFQVEYDAATEQWNGTLTVPTPDGASVVLTGSRSGLFPLLSNLDKQYRATLG